MKIGELIENRSIELVSPSFKVKKSDYSENGMVPIISQDESYISGYFDSADSRIKLNNYICFGDHTECVKYVPFEFVQGAEGLKIIKLGDNVNDLSLKFLYYSIKSKYRIRGSYERHYKYLRDLEIAIPPLKFQKKLVHTLDNFEAICNDLSIGLPAEIEARKKEYEFYRDGLLRFAETGCIERERERERA